MRLSSEALTPTFMSLRNTLQRTRAPPSRHTRTNMRSIGVARFLSLPVRAHAALWRPRGSGGAWQPEHTASSTGSGSWSLSSSSTRSKCREGWGRLSTPLQWGQLSWLLRSTSSTERFESASVPHLRLAQVDFDAGISPQLTLDQDENRDSSVWSADGVQIVEESTERLTREKLTLKQLPTRGVDQERTMLASTRPLVPHLPPEGRRGRCRVRHAKCNWKEKRRIVARTASRLT